MGLFKKKKDSSLHTLSESDIQKRLYGNLRPADKTSDSVPHKFKTIPTPETPAKSFSHAASSSTKSNYSNNFGKNDLFGETDVYADTVDKAEVPAVNSDEKEDITLAETQHEQNIMARLGEMAEKEKAFKQAESAPVKIKINANQPSEKPAPLGGSFNKSKPKKQVSLAVVLTFIVGLLTKTVGFIFGIFKFVNLRSAKIKTAAYWLLGAGVLVALFFGVHLLNVQREAAMKSPIKKKAAVVVTSSKPAVVSTVKQTKAMPSESLKPVAASPNIPVATVAPVNSEIADDTVVESNQKTGADEVNSSNDGDIETQSSGRYVIQVATYAGPNDANRIKEQFEQADIPVFVKSLSRPSGKIYYSLFLGRFKSYSEAQKQFERFKEIEASRPFKDAFIRTLSE